MEHNELWDRVIRRRAQRMFCWIEHSIDYTVSQYLYRFHKCKSKREQYKIFNEHLDMIFSVLRDALKEMHDDELRDSDKSLVLQLKSKYQLPRKMKKRKLRELTVRNLYWADAAEYWAHDEAWDKWFDEHTEYLKEYYEENVRM